MRYIYMIAGTTENSLGVLQRLACIFARNRLNIEQINISTTKNSRVSHFNLMIHADDKTTFRLLQQLQKMVELLEVKVVNKIPFVHEQNHNVLLTGEMA